MAACHLFFFQPGRREAGDHFGEQGLRPRAVVAAEVANVDIKRGAADFRPGVHCQVRFGENDGAGDAGRAACGITEGVKQAADDGEAVTLAGGDAESLKPHGVEQEARCAAAVVEVGDQVQAIHGVILLGLSGFT